METRRGRGARMLEAQRAFQTVVKQELQLLLSSGTKREEAVKLLLRRIVRNTDTPEPVAVRSVMRQFQMQHDDAVRALIVKQELARLKRQGMDSFAAIEELTRKMQQREVKKKVKEKQGKEDSLSLIQRIGQVSISSSKEDKKLSSGRSSPSGVDVRKRRACGVQEPVSVKKQKLCEVGDGFLVVRKAKSSATGSGSDAKNVHKRQRDSDEEPLELMVPHRHHGHHSKRHKSSTH